MRGKIAGAAEMSHVYSHPHRFERYNYTTPTYCELCSNVLWGPVKVWIEILKYKLIINRFGMLINKIIFRLGFDVWIVVIVAMKNVQRMFPKIAQNINQSKEAKLKH